MPTFIHNRSNAFKNAALKDLKAILNAMFPRSGSAAGRQIHLQVPYHPKTGMPSFRHAGPVHFIIPEIYPGISLIDKDRFHGMVGVTHDAEPSDLYVFGNFRRIMSCAHTIAVKNDLRHIYFVSP